MDNIKLFSRSVSQSKSLFLRERIQLVTLLVFKQVIDLFLVTNLLFVEVFKFHFVCSTANTKLFVNLCP